MYQHISCLLIGATSCAPLLASSSAFAGAAPGFPDFAAWVDCMGGPDVVSTGSPDCVSFDVTGDQHVDLMDFAIAAQAPVCGNGFVQVGEECDPPDGTTCGKSCLLLIRGEIRADSCAAADVIAGEGDFQFNNRAATRDGPAHGSCVFASEDNIDADVWGCWTAPCTATIFAQTCGLTEVDTKIAVYDGCTCPVGDSSLLACNDDRCDVQSIATFAAQAGASYLLRIGVYPGETAGSGVIALSCGLSACAGAAGPCDQAHAAPGCDDRTCCETVCVLDSYCCDTEWDDVCTNEAEGLCSGAFPACAPEAGACNEPNGSGGCDNVDCCNTVCGQDPFCCLNDWDGTCVDQEAMYCNSSCGDGAGDCFAASGNGSPGCEDPNCCAEVCVRDPFCCRTTGLWDSACAETAATYCR